VIREFVEQRVEGHVSLTAVIPDEQDKISQILREWADNQQIDLILTTGGTGFASRDVTPEATRAVIDREAPGLAEAIRAASLKITSHAMLSRAVSGIRGRTLIINLPGSPKAVAESMEIIQPVLAHAVEVLRDSSSAEARHGK
jgi:molybdenum cofactor synthesis domain-containing protein